MITAIKSMGSLRLFYRSSYLFRLSHVDILGKQILPVSSLETSTERLDQIIPRKLYFACWKFQQRSLLSQIHRRTKAWNQPYHFVAKNSLYHSSLKFQGAAKPNKEKENVDKEKEKDNVDKDNVAVDPEQQEVKKLGLVQRYKKMLKEYWYVLIPVHMVTSTIWFGSFYYLAKSGIDIVPFLEALGIGETFLKPLRNSKLGYLAVASAMYKLATPARYMVTLGGTTFSINYLTKRGLIKPMPSRKEITTMFQRRQGS